MSGAKSPMEIGPKDEIYPNNAITILVETQMGRIFYLLFFVTILDLPRLITRHFIGDLYYGGLLLAIIVLAFSPFIVPQLSIFSKFSFNTYSYCVFALTCLMIARGGSYFATMIFFSMVLFVLLVKNIGVEFFSKNSLGKYLEYSSVLLLVYAAMTANDLYSAWVNSDIPTFGVVHYSEGFLGYELSNLAFFLFLISVICGFDRKLNLKLAFLALVLSYCYHVMWAACALVITVAYLGIRKLYAHGIPAYFIGMTILLGVGCLTFFVYDHNPYGVTVRLKESMSALSSIYSGNNYYGLMESQAPGVHGFWPTLIYNSGMLGIAWIGLLITYFYKILEDIGLFFLISTIIFSYLFVYEYINVLVIVILYIALLMPTSHIEFSKALPLEKS